MDFMSIYVHMYVCVCVYESCWVQLVRKLYQTNNAVRGFLLSLYFVYSLDILIG